MFKDLVPWRFTLLTYAISWTLWALIAAAGLSIDDNLATTTAYLLGGFGPAFAGIILIHREHSANEQLDFWRRTFHLKLIRPGWWLAILLLYPASILSAILIIEVVAPDVITEAPWTDFVADSLPLMALNVIYIAIVGPISEEPGWRGYALDWLQSRRTPLTASIILGVMWWAWHLPLIGVEGSFLYGNATTAVFVAGYLGTVILYSILFTWVYNHNNRSVLAIIFMHFSVNMTTGILVPPFAVFIVTTFVLIAVVMLIAYRERMWQPGTIESGVAVEG